MSATFYISTCPIYLKPQMRDLAKKFLFNFSWHEFSDEIV